MTAEPRETASTTISLLLRHVQKHGGDWAVTEVLSRAGVEQEVSSLQDVGTWIGYDTRIRLFQAATDVLRNPETMFAVGLSAVLGQMQPVLVQLIGMFASPAAVYRQLPRMVPKFTTTSTIDEINVGKSSASIRYRLHDGYLPSRLDCQYARGLFSAVPTIFGLAPAEVAHPQCQSDGFPACVYDLTWSPRLSWKVWRIRRRLVEESLAVLRDRIREVQLAAADLVASDDIDEMLARIVERASSAVLAPAYLLVVETEQTGAPLVRQRGLSDERAAELVERMRRGDDLGDRALVVDIVSARRVHGHLAALFSRGHTSMDGDRALLEAYAGHAAAALDLFTALQESRQEGRRTSALLHFAHELAACDGTVAVAEVVASALPAIVGCDAGGVLLWDGERRELRPVAASGFDALRRSLFLNTAIPLDQTPEFHGLVARHQTLVLTIDDASPPVADLLQAIGARIVVVVPLLAGEDLMGLAAVAWAAPVGSVTLEDARVRIEGVSNQGATAMQRAHLLAAVRHQSQHDSLTGLPNRALFAHNLEVALQTSPAVASTAVMFCDLDNFKRVNDLLGHSAGDELLRQVAGRLRAQVGADDTIGRLGGDEFAVTARNLSGTDSVLELARRIVDCLNPPFHLAGQDLCISASVGVAVHPGRGGHGEQLLDAADTAMYVAKRSGGNQVSLAGHARTEDPDRHPVENR